MTGFKFGKINATSTAGDAVSRRILRRAKLRHDSVLRRKLYAKRALIAATLAFVALVIATRSTWAVLMPLGLVLMAVVTVLFFLAGPKVHLPRPRMFAPLGSDRPLSAMGQERG